MHIDGWSIDAFGALHDIEQRGLGDGLTVIYGPNEAGKSTLRHFVLGVLFGFTSGKSALPQYSPNNGGTRSGRLFLESDGEEFVLGRLEKRGSRAGNMTLLGPDGTARSDAELTALLGGLTRSVYDRVFAVGLDELNDLNALTDGDLQDHLLSAGVTGAGRIATQARNRLRARADTLHKARSSSTEVAAIRESLRSIEDQLRLAQQAAQELGERREMLAAKRTRAGELHDAERAASVQVQRADRLLELWPHYLEAVAAGEQLEAMGVEAMPLAPDAAEALATRVAAVDNATADVDRRQSDLDRALDQLKMVETGHHPDLAALHPDVAALQHRLGAWAQQEEEMLRRREELADLHRRFEFELDVIGIDEASELARVGAAVAARDHLRITRSAFDEKSSARRRAAEVVEHHQSELIEAESAVSAGMAALAEQSVDVESGSVRIAAERAAREALLLGELSPELSELDQRRRDLAVAEGKARHADGGSASGSGFEPRKILMIAGLLLAGSAVVAGIMSGPVAGIALGAAAAVLGGCAYLLRNMGNGRLDEDSRQGLVAVSNALERRCTDRARMLGFAGLPTLDEVAEQKAMRDNQAADLANLVAAQLRLDTARSSAKANKARLTELTQQHDAALGAWQQWLTQHNLPSVLRPEGVDEWLSHLDQARVLDDQIRQAERRERELNGSLEYAPKAVIELTERAERASRPIDGDDARTPRLIPVSITPPSVDSSIGELQAVVAVIAEVVADATTSDREVSRIQDQVGVLRAELARATKARRASAADLAAYFASAGVLNEAQLRRRLADQDKRVGLEQVVAAFDRRIETSSGTQADQDRTTLAERSPDAWTSARAKASEEVDKLAADRDAALREIGSLEGEVATIEASGDLASLALEREELVERLRRQLREWTVLHTAAGLIGHTLDRYLDERQPAVLQRAETHLRTITEGRYETIRLDPDASGTSPRLIRTASPRIAVAARRHPGELRPGAGRDLHPGSGRSGHKPAGHRLHLSPLGGGDHAKRGARSRVGRAGFTRRLTQPTGPGPPRWGR